MPQSQERVTSPLHSPREEDEDDDEEEGDGCDGCDGCEDARGF